ncbi:MAG: FoF1 ATP synthase subunit a [Candidatus Moranbacteria bacterium]|nr:FoF1 ATP synthase subunit a [Candidatus Moranbacteria bacterium]
MSEIKDQIAKKQGESGAGGSVASGETHEEIHHENTIFAETLFQVKGFEVTNSFLSSIVVTFVLVAFFLAAGWRIRKVPRGVQNFFEIILEGALGFVDSITGNRKTSEKLLPITLALFLFILLNNWFGILPIIGTIGVVKAHGGEEAFVPFFRGGTADLNMTLALSLFAVVTSHIIGVFSVGSWKHFNKFINFETLMEIPKKISKDKNVLFVNPIKFVVGFMEIISEFAKVASLSFRLFGNIFAGEVLLASMAMIFAFAIPLPFMFLEVLVGLVQAAVFAILTLVFMSMAMEAEH